MIWELQYLNLIADILENGEDRIDRTGVGTRAVFGRNLSIDLRRGFPAVTTKKLAWKAMDTELRWFLKGSSDERLLAEMLHGTRAADKKTIWTDNAQADYWKPKAAYEGDLGRVYGVQWRSWTTTKLISSEDNLSHPTGGTTFFGAKVQVNVVDQVAEVIKKIQTNPTDRRMIISAWNVGELDQMALPPCHMFAQFFVSKDKELSCQMYQRSVDVGLGLPFNIASYALLTHLIAHVSGCTVGKLNMVLGDTHIYSDHIEAMEEQARRTPFEPPKLVFNRQVTSIDDFKAGDYELQGYQHLPSIAMKMAV